MNTNHFLAIIFGIVSFSLKNIGYVFQKKGVNEIISRHSKPRFIHFIKNRIWCAGIGLPFVGGVSLVIGYGFGPVSMIMPFTGVGFVFLVLFVTFYLKEKIAIIEWITILVMLGGIICITLIAPDIRDTYSDPQIMFRQCITLKGLIFFIVPVCSILCLCMWSVRHQHTYSGTLFAAGAGIIGGSGLVFQKPFSVGIKLLHTNIPFTTGLITFFCGLLFISLSVIAIYLLNIAYKYGRGILVAPIYAIFQMAYPLTGGVLLFDEWHYLDKIGISLQVLGILFVIVATGFLVYHNERKIKKLIPSK